MLDKPTGKPGPDPQHIKAVIWHMVITPALDRWRREDQTFKDSHSYCVSLRLA